MFYPSLRGFAAAALIAAAAGIAVAQEPVKTLRAVPTSDLKVLDPIWTTATISQNHGYMIYDTLFGLDAQGKVQPQMVDKFTVSKDNLAWTFTLRPGLAFHDGKPVTGDDVVASLSRWAKRDPLGQRMFAALETIEAVPPNGFRLVFRQPFPLVLDALAKPNTSAPFVMPKRVADTPADKQIDDYTGSGPFIFKKDEFRPGEKVVYARNPRYQPRQEPPSGTAGGKRVYVDRVEWVILKDEQTQVNALLNGEVDMVELLPSGQYDALKKNPAVELLKMAGGMATLHLNHLVAPFNDPRIARAALLAINQEAMMRAQGLHRELYSTCISVYPCGTLYASQNAGDFTGKPQLEKARQLLKEAGYNGKPVVLLHPSDLASLNKYPVVYAQLLKQAGFNVDLQTMDWSTLITRRAKKDPAEKGGWNAFISVWPEATLLNPMFMSFLTGTGEKGWFGWATDDKLEALKSAFSATSDPAERKRLAEAIQLRVYETGLMAPIGQGYLTTAVRKGVVDGVVPAPAFVYWNIRKH